MPSGPALKPPGRPPPQIARELGYFRNAWDGPNQKAKTGAFAKPVRYGAVYTEWEVLAFQKLSFEVGSTQTLRWVRES
jgi:hypothetical protein